MKKQILFVDDEQPIRLLFSRILSSKNREILTVASGSEALERVQTQAFDLILLDLKMPGMNGAQTLRRIRETDRQVPVFIVTAFENEFGNALHKLQEAGVDFEILNKPIEKKQLLAAVESVLSGPQRV
jgi:CheY-like chemotaxis protein